MSTQEITFTLAVRVDDEAEFRRTAHVQALKDGRTEDEARAYLDPDEQSLNDCAMMILDPGVSPNGCTILGGNAESITIE